MTKRQKLSNTARAKLFAEKHGICHLCGGKVHAGEAWEVSHPIPIAMGGPDDETNRDVAHKKCHRDHTRKVDQPAIAKTERMRQKHLGIYRTRHPMQSRSTFIRRELR